MEFRSVCKHFDELSPAELYAVLKLRSDVFVVEQNCVFPDPDGRDPACYHLLVYAGQELAATARLVPAGVTYEYMSIGRVVSALKYRRQGAGRFLMGEAIRACEKLFGAGPIKIGAQVYLEKFYNSFGFLRSGEIYHEDGIDHIPMIRS